MRVQIDCKEVLAVLKQIVDYAKTEDVRVFIEKRKDKMKLCFGGSGEGTVLACYLPDAKIEEYSRGRFIVRIEILQKLLKGRKQLLLKHDPANSAEKLFFRAPQSKSSRYTGYVVVLPFEKLSFEVPTEGPFFYMNDDQSEESSMERVLKAVSLTPQHAKDDTVLSVSAHMGAAGTFVACGDAYHIAFHSNHDATVEDKLEFTLAQQTMNTIEALAQGTKYMLRLGVAHVYASGKTFQFSTEALSTEAAFAFANIQHISKQLEGTPFASLEINSSDFQTIIGNFDAIFERGVPVTVKFEAKGHVTFAIETNYGKAQDKRQVKAQTGDKGMVFALDPYTLRDMLSLVPNQLIEINFHLKEDSTGNTIPWVLSTEVPTGEGHTLYACYLLPAVSK